MDLRHSRGRAVCMVSRIAKECEDASVHVRIDVYRVSLKLDIPQRKGLLAPPELGVHSFTDNDGICLFPVLTPLGDDDADADAAEGLRTRWILMGRRGTSDLQCHTNR